MLPTGRAGLGACGRSSRSGSVAAVGALLFTLALHAGAAVVIPAAVLFGFGALGWNALVYVSAASAPAPELAARSVAVAATVVLPDLRRVDAAPRRARIRGGLGRVLDRDGRARSRRCARRLEPSAAAARALTPLPQPTRLASASRVGRTRDLTVCSRGGTDLDTSSAIDATGQQVRVAVIVRDAGDAWQVVAPDRPRRPLGRLRAPVGRHGRAPPVARRRRRAPRRRLGRLGAVAGDGSRHGSPAQLPRRPGARPPCVLPRRHRGDHRRGPLRRAARLDARRRHLPPALRQRSPSSS